MERPRKVLFLTTSLAPGGAETVVMNLALALRSSGCLVTVVSMLEPTAFVDELEAAGVTVISLGMLRNRFNFTGMWRFSQCLRRFRPDIIHAHMFHASILARVARFLTGIPAVCTIHSEIECSHRKNSASGLRDWIYRATDAAASHTTAVSERVRQRYVDSKIVPAHRIEVIDNGVDPDRFQPCPEQRQRTRIELGWRDHFVWLAVGRLELAKDYPNLIQAFQRVHADLPSARLAIVGEGRMRSWIEQAIESAGLQTAVALLGLRDDVPALLNACDALVMASAWEGGPLVLLEAGAAGRPVVSTRVGAASEIVVPGRTGLLVAPRDPASLARAMGDLMALGTETLDQMGERARRHIIDRFSLGSLHDRYRKLYEEVLLSSL